MLARSIVAFALFVGSLSAVHANIVVGGLTFSDDAFADSVVSSLSLIHI